MSPLHSVLFDDECSLCTFQSRLLSRLDWRGRLQLLPLSDPKARTLVPHLSREDLQEAIHCISSEGTIYRGARALRFIGLHLPALFPLSLLLWIPGVILLAEIVYRWISKNRYLLSKLFGCQQACSLLPPKGPQKTGE